MQLLYASDRDWPAGELDDLALIDLYRHPTGPGGSAYVRTNFVTSLDGSISGPDGRSGSINTPSDARIFALHRALADVILVGAQTVRTERYQAVDLTGWQSEVRRREGLPAYPALAIVTRSLDLDPRLAAPEYAHGPVVIITTGHSAGGLSRFTAAGIEVRQNDGDVDLGRAIGRFAAEGRPRVLCEGGPRLHRDLLAADLVDELSLTLAPTVVGGEGPRSTVGASLPQSIVFALQHVLWADDQTVFMSYRRRRSAS
jgi:riboflavin biosynthesis pyrimidine reductase